jgi:hypothetical protein
VIFMVFPLEWKWRANGASPARLFSSIIDTGLQFDLAK